MDTLTEIREQMRGVQDEARDVYVTVKVTLPAREGLPADRVKDAISDAIAFAEFRFDFEDIEVSLDR